MQKTDIEWADYTWSPVTGCSPASAGCDNCYAARIAKRFEGTKAFPDGFNVTLHPERLNDPRKLKQAGQMIFVCSMADLFHPDVPDSFIESVFAVMRNTPQHTFFVLTKRPERMFSKDWAVCSDQFAVDSKMISQWYAPNIWLGVSAENQEAADKRIPVLMDLPVAHRFVSVEPMLGPVDLCVIPANCHGFNGDDVAEDYFSALTGWTYDPQDRMMGRKLFNHLEWVICGGETGSGARKCQAEWVERLFDQCHTFYVPFFFKKWGSAQGNGDLLHGFIHHDWPSCLNAKE